MKDIVLPSKMTPKRNGILTDKVLIEYYKEYRYVAIVAVSHLYPFRTEKLSPFHADGTTKRCGRVGYCMKYS